MLSLVVVSKAPPDSGKILCNFFFSKTRRNIISPLLIPSLKEVILASSPGELLFDPDFGSRIQAIKSLEKVGKDLRSAKTFPARCAAQSQNSLSSAKKRGGGSSSVSRMQGNWQRPAHYRGEIRPRRAYPPRSDQRQRYKAKTL